ncbi:MAG: hypothetical protein HN389_10045 [Clostridia bacterium]|mgnify:CR=1 FL=1|jgi:hypothetical protein|nr:hypothetical protein [Clostridia bacterium]
MCGRGRLAINEVGVCVDLVYMRANSVRPYRRWSLFDLQVAVDTWDAALLVEVYFYVGA